MTIRIIRQTVQTTLVEGEAMEMRPQLAKAHRGHDVAGVRIDRHTYDADRSLLPAACGKPSCKCDESDDHQKSGRISEVHGPGLPSFLSIRCRRTISDRNFSRPDIASDCFHQPVEVDWLS